MADDNFRRASSLNANGYHHRGGSTSGAPLDQEHSSGYFSSLVTLTVTRGNVSSSRTLSSSTTYPKVSLDDVVGSLSLDTKWLIFSPDNINPARSWMWTIIKSYAVKKGSSVVEIVFNAGEEPDILLVGAAEPRLESVVFKLSNEEEAERLIKDIERHIPQKGNKMGSVGQEGSGLLSLPTEPPQSEQTEDTTRLESSASSNELAQHDDKTVVRALSLQGEVEDEQDQQSTEHDEREKFIDECDDNAKEEMEEALSEDNYSLFFIAHPMSAAFWFATFTIFCQITLLIQIFLDLFDLSGDPPTTSNGTPNRLQIPAGVDNTVTVAQFIGIFMTVNFLLDGGDLIKGFDFLCNGYIQGVNLQTDHANFIKWLLAGVLQSISGCLMLTDLFILSMQSTTVIMFCLNFAALHFVQEIDDVAFSVASMGLFGRRIQAACREVGEITISATVRRRTLWMRRILIVCLFTGMYTGFFVLMGNQWAGVYRCKSVYVQFGDAFGPELAYYSGRYESQGDPWDGRPSFLHESGELELIYSQSERAWMFVWTEDPSLDCLKSEYLIKSSETDTFDVVTVADERWYANMQGGVKPMDWLSLSCADCNVDRCWEGHGVCVDNICECDDDHMGLFCEIHRGTCNAFSLDYRTTAELESFKGGAFFLGSEFAVVRKGASFQTTEGTDSFTVTALVFERSVFYHLQMHAVVVFSGRRWIMFGSPDDNREDICPCDFNDYLERENIAEQDSIDALKTIENYRDFVPLYFSAPMDYNTPSDSYDFTGLMWFAATKDRPEDVCDTSEFILGYNSSILGYIPDNDYQISAQFLCSQCASNEDCHNDGRCNVESGVCECQAFYDGSMCEQTRSCDIVGCANDGTCDPSKGVCTNCGNQSAGNLCQYPLPASLDPFFCSTPNENWVDSNGVAWPANGECANSQKCNGLEQRCQCEPPFFGKGCIESTQTTCFLDSPGWTDPCENGGYCDKDRYPSHPICICPKSFTGDFCQLPSES